MFIISDPYLSVNLDNTTGVGAISRGGYPMETADIGPGDIYYDVEEKITVTFMETSDAYRAITLAKLAKLGRRARALQSPDHPDHLNPAVHVKIHTSTPTETSGRCATVKNIMIPKLASAHYSSGSIVNLELIITREGTWRGIDVTATPTLLNSSNVRSVNGMPSSTNMITIDPYWIDGDVPGEALITIAKSANFDANGITVVRRTNISAAALDTFEPFLWCASATTSYGMVNVSTLPAALDSITPDTLPVTTVHRAANAADVAAKWTINSGNYYGRYEVLVVHLCFGDAAEVKVTHGYGGELDASADWVPMDSISSTNWSVVSAGQIKIPANEQKVRGSTPLSNTYEIYLWTKLATTHSFAAGIILMPIDGQRMETQLLSTPTITNIDGEIKRNYYTSGGSYGTKLDVDGEFPTIQPGVFNRFYFFPGGGNLLAPPATNMAVTISHIPRWYTLATTGSV